MHLCATSQVALGVTYLKGLAETRARLAGDVQRYQQVLAEVTASLVKAQTELNACDTLIKKFDERLDPDLVQPIHAWQGRYGKRGALREANRGTFTMAFFLRCMVALKVDEVKLR